LSIFNLRLPIWFGREEKPIGNQQSKIGNSNGRGGQS